MKASGSVLIVVLGLLAILAVIGVTFVTMSNLDRRTATNFAIQSQFMLAADGAVDYVTHHMVQDLWAYNPTRHTYDNKLLSNSNEDEPLLRNEPFDYPHADWDPWLSEPITDVSMTATQHYSYKEQADQYAGQYYGMRDWGDRVPNGDRPNNLGFPDRGAVPTYVRSGRGHGGWIPELAAPFENGLIRISLTVIDHNAMINWNAHGNLDPTPRGYYISDVNPSKMRSFSGLLPALLINVNSPPGVWATSAAPGNPANKALVIENPGMYGDRPLTLDEEFELRRLTGTFWNDSRVETFGSSLKADPDTATILQAKNRLSVTTVSWTSESRPNVDLRTGTLAQPITGGGRTGGYNWRKADLNLDDPEDLYNAISAAPAFGARDTTLCGQFVANICGFRDGKDEACLQTYNVGRGSFLGASRQPLFSKARAQCIQSETDENGNVTKELWRVDVQIISPWPNNCVHGSDGLTISNIRINADGASKAFQPALPDRLYCSGGMPQPFKTSCEVEIEPPETLASKLQSITLECGRFVIDSIDSSEIAKLAQTGIHRAISFEDESRGNRDPEGEDNIRVVYIGGWKLGIGSGMESWEKEEPQVKIPIRFPRSVLDRDNPPTGGLPPVWIPGISDEDGNDRGFRAFPRVGDLNQVLCMRTARGSFWPWVTRVAAIADPKSEIDIKFCWSAAQPPTRVDTESRLNLANVVTVGGPWHDRLDNDGDGYTDDDGGDTGQGPDTGLSKQTRGGGGGKFGGPELRVAGKININTATRETLETLAKSFQITSSFPVAVMAYRQNHPFFSPAQILTMPSSPTCVSTDAKGYVEAWDLPYTRLSNILDVRSDTFSVYGTVQYGHVEGSSNSFKFQLVRSRRFWALVDRSPALAYKPGQDPNSRTSTSNFVRPRVLNFQWMD